MGFTWSVADSGILKVLSIVVIFLISIVGTVDAIGISPPIIDITFEPNYNHTYSFYVRNTENYPLPVLITPEGPQAQYIKPSITDVIILQPKELKTFSVNIELPEEIDTPGLHITYIRAEQYRSPDDAKSGTVSAYAAVSALVYVRVPYPGKYVESTLNIENVKIGEPVNFKMLFTSRGEEDSLVSGNLKVYDPDGNDIATFYFGDMFVESKGSASHTITWDTMGLPPGKYKAEATIDYGGTKPYTISKEFKIGDILMQIENVSYNVIHPNEIAKIKVTLDSYWNEDIDGVFMEMAVFDGNQEIFRSKSESFLMKSWDSKNVLLYWDVGDIEPGEYRLEFTANYRDKVSERVEYVEVKSAFDMNLIIILIVISVAVAIFFAIIVLRRKKKRKGEVEI